MSEQRRFRDDIDLPDVDMSQEQSVLYWSAHFSISRKELIRAVDAVGEDPDRIARCLAIAGLI